MSVLMKIIAVNVGVFLVLRVLCIVAALMSVPALFEGVMANFELPGSIVGLIHRPWTLLTYMFTQFDLMHILFNMLWLFWFGSIFILVMPSRRLLPLYLYGGLAGAVCYLLTALSVPALTQSTLVGSSAAVIAIVAATAMIVPDYSMRLLFLVEVKLKWIAIITIGIDLLGLNGVNIGGHIAHLGGALTGVLFAIALRRGTDITAWLANLTSPHFTKAPGVRTPRPARPVPADSEIDIILDKIKRSGYTSLTDAERKTLFSASTKQQPRR